MRCASDCSSARLTVLPSSWATAARSVSSETRVAPVTRMRLTAIVSLSGREIAGRSSTCRFRVEVDGAEGGGAVCSRTPPESGGVWAWAMEEENNDKQSEGRQKFSAPRGAPLATSKDIVTLECKFDSIR